MQIVIARLPSNGDCRPTAGTSRQQGRRFVSAGADDVSATLPILARPKRSQPNLSEKRACQALGIPPCKTLQRLRGRELIEELPVLDEDRSHPTRPCFAHPCSLNEAPVVPDN